MPPVRPAAQDGRHKEYAAEEERPKLFEGRQGPGVFTPTEFAAAGFFLPEQEVRADEKKVLVSCWWCGIVLDEWEDGDDLLGQHLLHTREPNRPREGGCRWALYLRDQQRWESGTRVRAAREPSTKEVTRDFSISSRRRSKRSSSPTNDDDPGGMSVLVEAAVTAEATSSPSGAVPKPPPKKNSKVPPPPPPKPAAPSAVQSEEESKDLVPAASSTSDKPRSSRGERAMRKLDSYAVRSPV